MLYDENEKHHPNNREMRGLVTGIVRGASATTKFFVRYGFGRQYLAAWGGRGVIVLGAFIFLGNKPFLLQYLYAFVAMIVVQMVITRFIELKGWFIHSESEGRTIFASGLLSRITTNGLLEPFWWMFVASQVVIYAQEQQLVLLESLAWWFGFGAVCWFIEMSIETAMWERRIKTAIDGEMENRAFAEELQKRRGRK